jgi:hypothetical protein
VSGQWLSEKTFLQAQMVWRNIHESMNALKMDTSPAFRCNFQSDHIGNLGGFGGSTIEAYSIQNTQQRGYSDIGDIIPLLGNC